MRDYSILKNQTKDNPSLVRKHVLTLPESLSFFYFCTVVLRYRDLDPRVHGRLCDFLVNPKHGRFRDATIPRSWFKTSVATIGKSMWLSVRDPNIRILIAMNTYDNAAKRLHTIKVHWQNNEILRKAFPELVPDFKKVRWSDACAEINRSINADEGTYEAIGSGGSVISRHYDHIIEDDLVYAKKDDLSGGEIQPNREDIEKAIGWHKLVYSLFIDPANSTLDNIGTRWAVHDLKDYIQRHETHFARFSLSAETDKGEPVWPNRFGREVLDNILSSQGPYMYATQYLNKPRDPADAVFQDGWLQYYEYEHEIPDNCKTVTIVDLALWGDSKGLARNVILTISVDEDNHWWVRRYDRGKFNPTEVINLMEVHAKQFKSSVWVEEIQYQRAIRHFARKRMEETGFVYYLDKIKYDGRSGAKDLRIRNIVNIAVNGMVHIKPLMKELINAWCDYPSGYTVDILDCIGYAMSGLVSAPEKQVAVKQRPPFTLDEALEDIEKGHMGTLYPFNVQCKTDGR